jgi:type I restriction enzyme, S subunit
MKSDVVSDAEDHISEAAIEASATSLVPPGSLLMVTRSGILSRTFPVARTSAPVAVNQDLKALVPNDASSAPFLHLALRRFEREILDTCRKSGTTVASIEFPRLLDFQVPLPPVEEQKRIVAKVEELTARSRRAKEALDAVPPLLDQLRQSILAAAFRGDLTADWRAKNPNVEPADILTGRVHSIEQYKRLRKIEKSTPLYLDDALFPAVPPSWCYRSVQELFDFGLIVDFADGNHGALYPRKADFGESGALFVTAQQVENGEVRFEESPRLRADKAAVLRKGWARGGDVLLTHNATVGRTARVPLDAGEFLLGTSVTFYRLNPTGLDRDWFFYCLSGPAWQAQLDAVMAQTTRDQVSIQKQAFFRIAVPPLLEQMEVARRLETVLGYWRRVERVVKASAANLDLLEAAVLGRAFRGGLAPQDPADEPASVLLERIRTARATAELTGAGSRRRSSKGEVPADAPDSADADDDYAAAQPELRSASTRIAAKDLSELDQDALHDEVFAALWMHGPTEKDEAVRRVAEHLRTAGYVDFQRLHSNGPLYEQVLGAIEATVRVGLLDRPKRGLVRARKGDATAYTADDWRHALVASLGTNPVDRDDAIRVAAVWTRDNLGLEFARLRADGRIIEGLRSAINSAIRRGEVTRHGATRISRNPSSSEHFTGPASGTATATGGAETLPSMRRGDV